MSEWTELGDDELETRLIQRGVPRDDARSWVDYREIPSAKRVIDMFLEEPEEEEVDE